MHCILPMLKISLRDCSFLGMLFLLFALTPVKSLCQTQDVEGWKGLDLQIDFLEKFRFTFGDQIRFRNNLSTFKSNILEGELTYKLMREIRPTIGYRFTLTPTTNVHRIFYKVNFRYNLEAINSDLLLRLLSTHSYEQNSIAQNVFRPRIGIKYSKKGLRLEPFFHSELWYLYNSKRSSWIRYRFAFGLDYKISGRNSLTFSYFYQDDFNVPDPNQANIFRLIFKIDITPKEKEDKDKLKDPLQESS